MVKYWQVFNEIPRKTRRLIFDFFVIEKISWHGDIGSIDSLGRIFNLKELPSTDPRFEDAESDIVQHTRNNDDWEDDWVFTDSRFDLLNCSDSKFIAFIESTFNPLVRTNSTVNLKIIDFVNDILGEVDYKVVRDKKVGKKQIYKILHKKTEAIRSLLFVVASRKDLTSYYNKNAPCVILRKDNWNDFGYQTLFILSYLDSNKNEHDIGYMKITDGESVSIHGKIDKTFEKLPKNYYSLGESLEYYEKLRRLDKSVYSHILRGLNDVVFSKPSKEILLNEIFKTSLLRSSESEKALKEAGKYFKLEYQKFEDSLNFTFKTKLVGASKKHCVRFNYKNNLLPHRINVLIGKNGTGKTQFLNRLANGLSGVSEEKKHKIGDFNPRPQFSKIITFSYGVFDAFDIDIKNPASYRYCGIRKDVNSLYSTDELKEKFAEAFLKMKENGRILDWFTIINKINNYKEMFSKEDSIDKILEVYDLMSSGQTITLTLIAEVLAFVENESLLLIDEPELHLHPNSVINFVSMLSTLLSRYDSYAVLATHSPIILQEIPSKYISVFRRTGNIPYIQKLNIETFGENYSVIAQEVFDLAETEGVYKSTLENVYRDTKSVERVQKLFKKGLSMNANIFLSVLEKENEKNKSA